MMPAEGDRAEQGLDPIRQESAVRAEVAARNWVNSTMIASTGMATFHQVIALLTRLNARIARKLITVKIAIRVIDIPKPSPVTFEVVLL